MIEDFWEYVMGVATILLVLAVILFILIAPYFEAKAYNRHRCPGQPEATYAEAFFAELRVETGSCD